MIVTPIGPDRYDRLTEIWEAAVRATHRFLTEDDIVELREKVRREYLPMVDLAAFVDETSNEVGFIGFTSPEGDTPARVDMLFVDPSDHDRGIGRNLIDWVSGRFGPLKLEVNEQNPGGLAFYERLGFQRMGRSEIDNQGRPFPLILLHREKQG